MRTLVRRLIPPFLLPLAERVESSSIGSRLARGTFWSLVGTVMARGLSVLASIIVARHLGKEGFGEFGIIQSTVLNFSVFAGYGLGVTATKHIAEFRSVDPDKAGRVMTLSGLVAVAAGGSMALAVACLAPLIAERVLAAPQLTGLLRVGALMLFLNTLNGAQTGALSGFEAFRSIARVNLLAGLAAFPLTVGGVLLGGLEGGVWGMTISAGFTWMLAHLALRSEARRSGVPFRFRGAKHELGVLIRFSLPTTLASICFGPVGWACSALLVNRPEGYGEIGAFNAATQWFALVMFLPGLLAQVVLPILADSMGRSDAGSARRTLMFSLAVNAAVSLPVIIAAAFASPWIMSAYGEGFVGEWPTLVVVLLTAGILAIQSPLSQILNARGKAWTIFRLNLVWAAVSLGACWYLVRWGALGLALSRLAAFSISAALTYWVVSRTEGMFPGDETNRIADEPALSTTNA